MASSSGAATGGGAGQALADDTRLLEALRSGDPTAFDQFVERFGSMILAFGLRMCGRREDAEDIFQETLIKVFTQLRTLDAPEALRTWLWRVVANECRMSRRGPRDPARSVALEDLRLSGDQTAKVELPDATAVSPEESLVRSEDRRRVERALGELSPEQRIIILLRDFEELSTAEVATVLGISEANAKVRLHRARLALRARLTGTTGHTRR